MTEGCVPTTAGDMPMFDLVVVGAGPAGLSAALTAADHGLHVVVVDEQHDLGGQIFRQPPQTFRSPPSSAFKSYAFGEPLLARVPAEKRRLACICARCAAQHALQD